jgi:hypothetical protein
MKTIFKAAPFILSAAMMAACEMGPPAGISAQTAEAAPVDTTDYSQPVDRIVLTVAGETGGGKAIADLSFKEQPTTLGDCKALGKNATEASYRAAVSCFSNSKIVGNFNFKW